MAGPHPTQQHFPMKDGGHGASRLISLLITAVLCLGLWFGLDAMSAAIGNRAAEAASLLVFFLACGGIVWRWTARRR